MELFHNDQSIKHPVVFPIRRLRRAVLEFDERVISKDFDKILENYHTDTFLISSSILRRPLNTAKYEYGYGPQDGSSLKWTVLGQMDCPRGLK